MKYPRISLGSDLPARLGLVLAAILVAGLFFLLGVLFRVLLGPVSLGPLNGELRAALKQELPGLQLKFDQAALEWSREEGRINLVIFGTRIFDRDGRIIAQSPEAEVGLSAGPFLAGKIIIRRIALVGVQLTLVHTRAGSLRLGIEKDRWQSDIVKTIRDAIARNSMGEASALQSFAVHRARLALYDEGTGLFVVAPEAELQITNRKTGEQNPIKVAVDARLEVSGKPSRLLATFTLPSRGNAVGCDFSVSNLSLPAFASNTPAFSFLKPFALTADVSGSFTLLNGTSIRYADIGVGASGWVDGLGRPLHVRSLRMVARYDGAAQRLLVDDADLQAEGLRARVVGTNIFSFDAKGELSSSAFSLLIDRLAANMPGILPSAVSSARASLRGTFTSATRELVLNQFAVSGGALSANFTGKISLFSNEAPAIRIDGKVDAMGVRDFLRFWPYALGGGARGWVEKNVTAGRIGPWIVHADIPGGALDRPVLPEASLSVDFPVSSATVTYIRGLTPLTNVAGTAKLTGDTFSAQIVSASVGTLALSHGRVTIPNLHMHGTVGDINAHVEGSLPQTLSLLDMSPLQYPSRFHINPATTQGNASLDFDFRVPMVKNLSVASVGMSGKAAVNRLAVALGAHTRVTDGTATFDIDNSKLHASGQIAIGPTNLNVDWMESFNSAPVTTRLTVKGMLDDAARSAFGLHTEQILSGPVGVVARMYGRRGVIEHADIDADLSQANLVVGLVNLKKPAGSASRAAVAAQFDAAGDMRSADIALAGGQISAQGRAVFGTTGDLERLDLPSVRDGALNDFALSIVEAPGSGLNLSISGHSADGTALGHRSPKPSTASEQSPGESNEPFRVSARLDRLAMREGVNLAPFSLEVSGSGRRPKMLALSAMLSKTAQVTASITSSDAARKVTVESNDAGLLLKGLFGFTSIRGGQLSVSADMPPMASHPKKGDADYSGQAVVRDCTVVNQAFLTRLFSSGSLEGFVDLMRGQGVAIDSLQVPFRVTGDVIEIHDARAAGPSIGVTTDGYIDRANDQLALEGAIAPLYGINGVLGGIPVLGNLFVSKKGEGIFGVTYHASGNADEPQVVVNPLAMLAPGIFRRIFEGRAPSAPPTQAAAEPRKSQ